MKIIGVNRKENLRINLRYVFLGLWLMWILERKNRENRKRFLNK